ncbi:hypothetical protein [Paenibacillus odorifer]|uniref:hypothetical protein n=1 Tax=Paenibacillus odorifer TaxID=189426 RepID=UPI00096FE804|nr:hypothetical protein [Paenibacillus odorifer]OME19941.1 hypothetical protein BSK57_23520 [Paenibacillus odorifer]
MPRYHFFRKARPLLAATMGSFLALWVGALVGESKGVYSSIVWPITSFGSLLAKEGNNDFLKILFGGLSFIVYMAIISFPVLLFAKYTNENENFDELVLYTSEIASTIEVIEDASSTDQQVENAVDNLMANIGSQFVDIFKDSVSLRQIRYTFLVREPMSNDIMTVKLANHFNVTDQDLAVIDWVCANHPENPYLKDVVKQVTPSNDMEVIGLIRNPGAFRFGFVIFLPKKELITETTKSKFAAAAFAVQHIAYMDKLCQLMVLYNSRRLTGGGTP